MNFELAERLYDAAISSSKTHKFVNEEALANNLPVIFILRRAEEIDQCNTSRGRLRSITSGVLSQSQIHLRNILMRLTDD
jgi:hypothetical protein